MTDEEFIAWLEVQPDIVFDRAVYEYAMSLYFGKRYEHKRGNFVFPVPPFLFAAQIRENMIRRVAEQLDPTEE